MRTHLAIFFADRGDVAVLKTHVINSPNLMGWVYWRFTAINLENRGNGHTWRVPANLIAIFADRRNRRTKSPISGMSDIGDLIRRHSPSVPVPAIFYVYCCESPVKPTHQVGRFYHMSFQNCHIATIGEKNRQVCPHAIFAGDQIRRDRRIKSPGVSLALKQRRRQQQRRKTIGLMSKNNRSARAL